MKIPIIKIISVLIIVLTLSTSCRREEMVLPSERNEEENLDIQPPSVIIQSPTTEFSVALNDDRVSISGIAADNDELSSVTFTSKTESGEVNGLKNWLIPDLLLEMGDNKISVTATDKSFNSQSDEIIITRNRYLAFLSQPFSDPSNFYSNTATRIRINISIAPIENLLKESVKLVEVDEDNNIIKEIASLYDDGDLNHGDDIKGDWVFSTHADFNESSAREMRLRVSAKTKETSGEEQALSAIIIVGVYDKLSGGDYQTVVNLYDDFNVEFEKFMIDNTLEESLTKVLEWAISSESINSAKLSGKDIELEFSNGLKGSVKIFQKNAAGEMIIKGSKYGNRNKKVRIPLAKQTRGTILSGLKSASYDEIVTNKKLLIWAPFELDFSIDMSPSIISILNDSKINFSVTSLANDECTVSSLNNLTDYGMIIFDSHGSEGREIGSGEDMTSENFEEYSLLLKSEQIETWNSIILDSDGEVEDIRKTYCIKDKYISSLSGSFPNSIIFNGSCESTKNPDFKDAFLEKGAKTYFGFDKVVNTRFCSDMADDIVEGLVIDIENLSEIFINGKKDPVDPFAQFELYGNDGMYYTLFLINGDFESGNLLGWNANGDGRVISQLGSELVTEGSYMGIVSTGLGFTTSTGEISQQFFLPENQENLNLKWNFLSEEFMEWVGSDYQDYIRITLIEESGTEHNLFEKNIDNFNENYTLNLVSPEIIFDQGDVYSTGWQTSNFDLSAFSGQNITLIIKAGDIGDSMYDSALLLDEIETN